jgi:hypothetical protein
MALRDSQDQVSHLRPDGSSADQFEYDRAPGNDRNTSLSGEFSNLTYPRILN